MTFYLVLKIALGLSIIGTYDSDKACQEAGVQYMAMLIAQKNDDRKDHGASMRCIGYPHAMPSPREISDA